MVNFFRLKGYTLVELAVVLSIIIIIYASVAMSSMYLFPKRAEGESKQIMSDLILARNRASSSQLNSCFAFYNQSSAMTNYTYAIYNGTCPYSGSPISNVSLASFVTSPDTASPFNISVYNMTSSPTGVAGTFGLPSGLTQMRISVQFINSTKTIRLFNVTGFVRKE